MTAAPCRARPGPGPGPGPVRRAPCSPHACDLFNGFPAVAKEATVAGGERAAAVTVALLEEDHWHDVRAAGPGKRHSVTESRWARCGVRASAVLCKAQGKLALPAHRDWPLPSPRTCKRNKGESERGVSEGGRDGLGEKPEQEGQHWTGP
eukprot:2141847-Rhodomonas_salina.3